MSVYPITIWAEGGSITPGLIDLVSSNITLVLRIFGIPVSYVAYYSTVGVKKSHLFIAIDEKQNVITTSAARLSFLTAFIDVSELKTLVGSLTDDPLGILLDGKTVRINRFPAVFGFPIFNGNKSSRFLLDRKPEIEVLRREGYLALSFLPVPGVDYRKRIASEIATLWGFSVVQNTEHNEWNDILLLKNDTSTDDEGGEIWLYSALNRVQEDLLPIVEIEGMWMSEKISRWEVFYAVLKWFEHQKLPYITARTFHCYVRRDLSAFVTLGSLTDKTSLIQFLESFDWSSIKFLILTGKRERDVATQVYSNPGSIAIKTAPSTWVFINSSSSKTLPIKDFEKTVRDYFTHACNDPTSPISSVDVLNMEFDELLKITRVAECDSAKATGVCFSSKIPLSSSSGAVISHRAYRAAVRTHGKLRTHHDTMGVYTFGSFASPYFPISSIIKVPPYIKAIIHRVSLAGRGEGEGGGKEEPEDSLLKALVGTVWVLSAVLDNDEEVDIVQVATDRDEEYVKKILFQAWRSGVLIGAWCRVMITHRDTLSVLAAGGTVDPLLAHAGDSVADGNRWLDVTEKILTQCASR